MAEAVRNANRAARSLWRSKTKDNTNTRPIPAEIKKNLVEELERNAFTKVSSGSDIYQIIVNFTTPEGKTCHITLHTGGKADKEGAAGAFHIKIEDTPPTFGKSGAKEPTYRYYRFEPFVVSINGNNILHFKDISYRPQETSVYGATKPINPPILNTHMQTVMGLLNFVNIPMGTSPSAPAPSKKQEAAAPAVFAAANEEEDEEHAASVIAARLKKEQSRTVPESWEEEAGNNGNKPNKPEGGRRNHRKTKKNKRRRNRTRRN